MLAPVTVMAIWGMIPAASARSIPTSTAPDEPLPPMVRALEIVHLGQAIQRDHQLYAKPAQRSSLREVRLVPLLSSPAWNWYPCAAACSAA